MDFGREGERERGEGEGGRAVCWMLDIKGSEFVRSFVRFVDVDDDVGVDAYI